MNNELKRPIAWALVFLIFGIVAGMKGFFFFLIAVFLCVVLYKYYRYWQVVFFLLFFLIGAWRIDGSLHNHTAQTIENIEFSGVVIDTGVTSGGNQRAVVGGVHPRTGGRVRIMVYIRAHRPQVELGQSVTIFGELQPLAQPINPGGYNQFQHLRSQKIDAVIWAEHIERGEINTSLITVLRKFRDKLSAVYDGILPMREAAVMKSMILGDRLDLPNELADLYRVMGIYHILSISGLHITVLMLAANKLLALVMRERRAGILVLVMMVLYCLMTGAAVATVRAVLMGGVLIGAKIFGREYDLLAAASLACAALLIYEPLYIYNAGFQLSFGAVFGIGALSAPVERLLAKMKFPLRKNLAAVIAAVASTNIILAYHFYEISLYSVIGNLIILPTASFIIVIGMLTGLIGIISINAAFFLSGAVYYVLRFYEFSARILNAFPFAVIRTGGNFFAAVLGVLVLCAFAYAFYDFKESHKKRKVLLLSSIFTLTLVIFVQKFPPRLQISNLQTEGNYIVLRRFSDTLIIGAPYGGENDVLTYLNMRGINRAALLLTHAPDADGAKRIAQMLPRVHTLYLPDGSDYDLPHENIIFLRGGDERTAHGVTVKIHSEQSGQINYEIICRTR